MIVEEVIQWLADGLAYATLAVILFGIWQGTRRRAGRMSGPHARWLAVPWFYLITTLLFLALCSAGWRSLPFPLHGAVQGWLFGIGSLIYFPGMLLVLWGRLELGRNYFASTALAVRLFEDHQLVMTGPFAIMRHPMYLGLILAAVGSVPMYFTWTTLFFVLCAPLLYARAQTEERVLAAEFGGAWFAYCGRVPMFFPRLRRHKAASLSDEDTASHRPDLYWNR